MGYSPIRTVTYINVNSFHILEAIVPNLKLENIKLAAYIAVQLSISLSSSDLGEVFWQSVLGLSLLVTGPVIQLW